MKINHLKCMHPNKSLKDSAKYRQLLLKKLSQ
jgi:hypothetical protein